jgi:hypothetical protein
MWLPIGYSFMLIHCVFFCVRVDQPKMGDINSDLRFSRRTHEGYCLMEGKGGGAVRGLKYFYLHLAGAWCFSSQVRVSSLGYSHLSPYAHRSAQSHNSGHGLLYISTSSCFPSLNLYSIQRMEEERSSETSLNIFQKKMEPHPSGQHSSLKYKLLFLQ